MARRYRAELGREVRRVEGASPHDVELERCRARRRDHAVALGVVLKLIAIPLITFGLLAVIPLEPELAVGFHGSTYDFGLLGLFIAHFVSFGRASGRHL